MSTSVDEGVKTTSEFDIGKQSAFADEAIDPQIASETFKQEYLLRSHETYIGVREGLRARLEQLAQLFLAAATATGGGVLLIVQVGNDFVVSSLAVFLGLLALLVFAVISFFFFCANREQRTRVNISLFLTDQALIASGVKPVDLGMYEVTGFWSLAVASLIGMSIACGLIAALAADAGIAIYLYLVGGDPFGYAPLQFSWYGLAALSAFICCFALLMYIGRQFIKKSEILVETAMEATNEIREAYRVKE